MTRSVRAAQRPRLVPGRDESSEAGTWPDVFGEARPVVMDAALPVATSGNQTEPLSARDY